MGENSNWAWIGCLAVMDERLACCFIYTESAVLNWVMLNLRNVSEIGLHWNHFSLCGPLGYCEDELILKSKINSKMIARLIAIPTFKFSPQYAPPCTSRSY